MKNKISNILDIKRKQRRVTKDRETLKELSRALHSDAELATRTFVEDSFNRFIKTMKSSWNYDNYINGVASCDFTKHVARTGLYISESHRKAQREYTAAFRKLNKVFLDEALNNTAHVRERLIYGAGIKNA